MANPQSGAAPYSAARNNYPSKQVQNLTTAAAKRLGKAGPQLLRHHRKAEREALTDLVLLCAVSKIAKQRGTTLTQQMEVWEVGE